MGAFSGAANARPSADATTIEYNGNTLRIVPDGLTIPGLGYYNSVPAAISAATHYVAPFDMQDNSTTQADHQWAAPAAGVVVGITIGLGANPSAGQTLTASLQVNGSDVGTTAVVTDASALVIHSAAFSAPFAKGDLIGYRLTGTGVGSLSAGTNLSIGSILAVP